MIIPNQVCNVLFTLESLIYIVSHDLSRLGRVVPLSQIHSLRPSLQPRAWLDVMASVHTTRDDKNEAMQEILILAKDKVSPWVFGSSLPVSIKEILITQTHGPHYPLLIHRRSLVGFLK